MESNDGRSEKVLSYIDMQEEDEKKWDSVYHYAQPICIICCIGTELMIAAVTTMMTTNSNSESGNNPGKKRSKNRGAQQKKSTRFSE